ncbi:lysyl-tRNA synthetase, class 2 [Fontimonas thermophila]|uniref:Lysyl-tRNA synthetase, class 2 n=1 Tax=Fontimonas thermophila TaxID=1076937 RepID=A0A1I2IKU7_9GAMM|nr:EF-P lysine aminoacylase EpmA [Fontimonas thermophila]SFF42884.1 lysyl-tRNA synthetase, class 2 [Fontimonas thermophila]
MGCAVPHWRPSATLATLKARAELYGSVRSFFAARGVLEVETPILSHHATVDRHIDSFAVSAPRATGAAHVGFLQTSPEFAMKRLLASGSGPIFQIARVFRAGEQGRYHNPEFTLLEWYRPGFDHHALMDELAELLAHCGIAGPCARLSYREAFERHAGFDPHMLDACTLRERLRARGLAEPQGLSAEEIGDADFWLDLWMSQVVGPCLGTQTPEFVYDFPATQAALARVRPGTPPLAERFELFWKGVELANGFHELTDADEQQRRFEADRRWRAAHGRSDLPYDRHLIEALRAGLPPCAGVAVGLDRLLMLKLALPSVAETLAFAGDRA